MSDESNQGTIMLAVKNYYWRYSQIVIIILLGLLISKELWIFSGGLLGAFTIYILVRKQMHWLTEKKKMPKSLAAGLILLEVIICFLIPANIAVVLVVKMAEYIIANIQQIEGSAVALAAQIQEKLEVDLLNKDVLIYLTGLVTKAGKVVIGEITSFLVNAFILLFVLYFMLVASRPMEKYLFELLPFKDKNKTYMSERIKEIMLSNAIGIPLLAVVQGITATIGYLIFDVPLAYVFGLLTCFATIIPLLGTALIWVPLVLYLALIGDWMNALGLAIFGAVIISNVDNLFRFLLQKKMADIHPLITVFGVFVGLPLFGFWGVIFGPLMISVFLLIVDMFKKEYLDKKEDEPAAELNE